MAFLAALILVAPNVYGQDNEAQDIKKIALSFDDIPRHQGAFLTQSERREMIVKSLNEGGVQQAVFFLNPARIDGDAHKDVHVANIKAYVDAGHVLANHTGDHPRLSDISAEDFIADIDAAETWLKAQKSYRPWFRFPYLDEGGKDKTKRDTVRNALAKRGLRNGYVTAGASDWLIDDLAVKAARAGKAIDQKALSALFVESHLQSANFAHDLGLRTLGRAPVQVMLLHEADVTALYLADLIAALRADGWLIVSADEAYSDPLGNLSANDAYAGGTILEMLASEKDIMPRWNEHNKQSNIIARFERNVIKKAEQ